MVSSTSVSYDYLVFAVGAEVQTFNIPGVREHACFMKELDDAEKVNEVHAFFTSVILMQLYDQDATPLFGLFVSL